MLPSPGLLAPFQWEGPPLRPALGEPLGTRDQCPWRPFPFSLTHGTSALTAALGRLKVIS